MENSEITPDTLADVPLEVGSAAVEPEHEGALLADDWDAAVTEVLPREDLSALVTAVAQPDDPRPVNPLFPESDAVPKTYLETGTDDPARATLGTPGNPIGTLNPAHPVYWHGRNIMGVEYQGSAESATQAIHDSMALGSSTCHTRFNPAYQDPNPVIPPVPLPDPDAVKINKAYAQGYADADAAYQDLKALCLAFGNEQAVSTSDDVEQKYPFVAYARFNR